MSTLTSTLLRLEFHASHNFKTPGGKLVIQSQQWFCCFFQSGFIFPLCSFLSLFLCQFRTLFIFVLSVGVLFFMLYDFSYNKTEDLVPGSADMLSFSHLMLGVLSENRSELAPYASTHTVLYSVPSYSGLRISWNAFPFLHIKTRETLWVLKKFVDSS